jgi:hypothetical protein
MVAEKPLRFSVPPDQFLGMHRRSLENSENIWKKRKLPTILVQNLTATLDDNSFCLRLCRLGGSIGIEENVRWNWVGDSET